jgi:hypothetical protein
MPWEPGKSGNPGGRPKTRHLTDILGAELEKAAGKSGQSREQRMIERLVTIAITGKRSEAIQAMKLIFAYRDGLPVQPVDIEIRRVAERLAADYGLNADDLIREAEEIVSRA